MNTPCQDNYMVPHLHHQTPKLESLMNPHAMVECGWIHPDASHTETNPTYMTHLAHNIDL